MGFLNKDAHYDELLAAIRAVSRGDGAPHPSATRVLVRKLRFP
jgi:DNA-binding NarL/FixJ family response regulator